MLGELPLATDGACTAGVADVSAPSCDENIMRESILRESKEEKCIKLSLWCERAGEMRVFAFDISIKTILMDFVRDGF
jgi:hypothetical protein